MPVTTNAADGEIQKVAAWVATLRAEISQVIVGQENLIDRLLVGLLANGHVLLEGVPGLAKTLSVRTLSSAIQAQFHRIQFTPDLLPADIVGTLIYNPQDGKYHATRGPIFANLVLATENPIDQEGTYPLPEAQVDRFMFKVIVGYPSFAEERKVLDKMAFASAQTKVKPVISLEEILHARQLVDEVHVDEKIRDYIVHLVFATRTPKQYKLEIKHFIQFGASPRATIFLTVAAKAWALLQGRNYVTPEDVKEIGPDVLRHRIILTYEAEAQGITSEEIIKKIFNAVPVP